MRKPGPGLRTWGHLMVGLGLALVGSVGDIGGGGVCGGPYMDHVASIPYWTSPVKECGCGG
jgi:hypothetical protein